MAELPDLTVFALTLNRKFKGKRLKKLEIFIAKKLNVTSLELQKRLENQVLEKVDRVGKTLQFRFGKSEVLGLHLMLRGELKEVSKDQQLPPNAILSFHFTGGIGLAVTDSLKQATATLKPAENIVPDALDIKESDFIALLSKKSKKIKTLLMDQKLIGGIGNSYADEILWDARISPLSIANKIPNQAAKKLYKSISDVLEIAISAMKKENKGELRGELRDFMNIHGANIKKSPTGKRIQSEKINGRTAYFTEEQNFYG